MGIEGLGRELSELCRRGLDTGRQAGEKLVTTIERAEVEAGETLLRIKGQLHDVGEIEKQPRKGIPARVPDPRLKTPVPLSRQTTDYTCGPSSLLSVARYYGIHTSEMELAAEAGTTKKDGTTPMGLVEAAGKHGLKAEVITEMTIDQLKTYLDRKIPVIVDIQAYADKPGNYAKDWKDGHYVVAVGYDSQHLFFMDPSIDKANGELTPAELEARWHDYEVIHHHRINFVHAGIPIEGTGPVHPDLRPHPFNHID